ncbi:MAG: hypothetical protein J6P72_10065 [Firmicutes bacterium]|nr:hypothetical protein [Bacillota bacterium]
MSYLLIFLMILLYSFQTLFCKQFSDHYPQGPDRASQVFCLLESIFIALMTFAFNGFRVHISLPTLGLGALNALMLFTYNTSLIKASSRGSYAFMNMVLLFGGIIVPLIYSALILKEPLAWYKYASVVLMLVSFLLMNLKGIDLKGSGLWYYVFCILLFISNGLYGTLMKIQAVVKPNESREMVMLTFLLMCIPAAIGVFKKETSPSAIQEDVSQKPVFQFNRKSLIYLAASLISAGLAVNVLVLCLPLVNTVILYTVDNGGVLVLASLYSYFLFKEKFDPAKIIGIVLAVISITILSV